MFKFNYNVFKSNCNALSKQFNQVRSTCVVYHDLCQESLQPPPDQPLSAVDGVHGGCSDGEPGAGACGAHDCQPNEHRLVPSHQEPAAGAQLHHLHHHNHEHGLVYSKRVRSILLLNALFSPGAAGGGGQAASAGRVSPTGGSTGSGLSCTWNACTEQIRHYAKKAGKEGRRPKAGKAKVELSDEEMRSVIDLPQLHADLDRLHEQLRQELIANVNLKIGKNLEDLPVEFDAQTFQLRQLAQISRKNANLICLNLASCPDAIKPVLEAIRESGVCINPQQDGTMVYVPLPKVTKEHRENLAKSAKTLLQRTRDELKTLQNAYLKQARGRKQEKLADDLIFNVCENVRCLVEERTAKCEQMLEDKLKQLLE